MAQSVLVVDGSSTAALRARLILEHAGYSVTLATDTEEGLNRAVTDTPDLVILDTVLPRSSGYEVCGRLKLDPQTEHVPVVLAADEGELASLQGRVGFCPDRFVPKPYDPATLLIRVDEAIAGQNGHGAGPMTAVPDRLLSLPAVGEIALREGRIVAANESAGSLFETEPESLVGRSLSELLHNEPEFLDSIKSVAAEGADWFDCDVRVNGRQAPSRWRIYPVADQDQDPEAMRLALVDISAYAQLERELEQARVAAEEAARTRGRFLANMSHELRTPLHEVIGMLDLSVDGELPPEKADYLATARRSADGLMTTVSDVLEFTELEAGELALEEAPFDVRDPMQRVVDIAAPGAKEKGLALSSHIGAGVPALVHGDGRRLRQVLARLVDNAVKFTDAGRVSLEVGVAEESDGEVELRFRVQDTGPGVDEEKREVIFEPFSQADDSATRQFGGLGLGLATSQRLVDLMGGRLWLESEVGTGSTFHVAVPFTLPEQAAAEPSGPGDERPTELKILVAEDSPTNQLIARKNLEKAGHCVTIANNGLEAVAAVKAETWDLVLMDVAMPEMDGLDATRAIRDLEKTSGRHVPIIATTAFATKEYQDKCIASGMDGYVSKPVSVAELAQTIAPFLAARAETAEEEEDKPASLPAVDLEAALEVVGGDEELLQAVAEMSLSEIPEQLEHLAVAVAERDAAGVEAGAHRLKGVLANLGGLPGRDAAQVMETMGETQDLSGVDEAYLALKAEAERVVAFYSDRGK